MRVFLSCICLVAIIIGCTIIQEEKQQLIKKPDLKSVSWTMDESGVKMHISFKNRLQLDSLYIYFGIEFADSNNTVYGGDYCLDTLFFKGKKQVKLTFSKEYFSNRGTDYKSLLGNKSNLRMKLFHIYSYPMHANLMEECRNKPLHKTEYFDYRLTLDSKTVGSNKYKKNSTRHYTIKNQNNSNCKLLYYK